MKQRGFTLVEVLIALVVFSFIAIATAKLQVSNLRNGAEVRAMDAAKHLATTEMADKSPSFNQSLQPTESTTQYDKNGKTFTVNTSVTAIDYNTRRVVSEVTWDDYGQLSKLSISTIEPTFYRVPVFIPHTVLPLEVTCEDANKGYGNDFFNWDPDNKNSGKKIPKLGAEETCTFTGVK